MPIRRANLIDHDRNVGVNDFALGISKGDSVQDWFSIRYLRLPVGDRVCRLSHDVGIGGNRDTMGVEKGHLDSKWLSQLGVGVRADILNHALGDKEGCIDEGSRYQQVIVNTKYIDPEISQCLGGMSGDSANQGGGDGNSHGGRGKIVDCQADHHRVEPGPATGIEYPYEEKPNGFG